MKSRFWGAAVVALTSASVSGCESGVPDEGNEEETGELSDEIAQGIEDTGDMLRQVVQVQHRNGICSGTLISPQLVLFAGHIASDGNSIVTRPAVGVPYVSERRTGLQGSASTLAALDAIL